MSIYCLKKRREEVDMPKVTQKDALIKALAAEGWKEGKKTSKSVKLVHPDHKVFYFVGNAGSLRKGANKVGSIPVADATKARLLAAGGYSK